MATSWGSVNGWAQIGIGISTSNTNTQTTVTATIYIWTKYSIHDSDNTLYFNWGATSASTSRGAKSIYTTNNSSWSESNIKTLASYSTTYTRGTSAKTYSCAAKLTNVYNCGTMTASTSYTIPALASYKVAYSANGGSGAPSAQTKYYGTTLKLSTTKPTRTGYTFSKWNTASGGGGTSYASGANYPATANAAVTLYAQWTANTYTVTFNANGGSSTTTKSETYGSKYTLPSNPTRTGYTFNGWWTTASGGSQVTTSTTVSTASNHTLYAHWTANTYTVSFNANSTEATGSMANETFTYDVSKALTANAFEWQYHEFLYWTDSPSVSNGSVKYTDRQSVSNLITSGSITLYAVWKELYVEPTVIITNAYRSTSGGLFADDGPYFHLDFTWTVDTNIYTDNVGTEYTIKYKEHTATSYTTLTTGTLSETSGNISYTSGSILSDEKSYDILIEVNDSHDAGSASTLISVSYFTVDFRSGGHGIAFGCSADEADTAKFAMKTKFNNDATFNNPVTFNDIIKLQGTQPTISMKQTTEGSEHDADIITGYATENQDGINLVIGGEGNTIIGAGESPATCLNNITDVYGTVGGETMFITSDGSIELVTNIQAGWENRKLAEFNKNGNLYIAGHLYTSENYSQPIGHHINGWLSSDKTCASGTWYALCSVSLTAGMWILQVGVRWNGNSSGNRQANISTTSADTAQNISVAPATSSVTSARFDTCVTPTGTTTYYLNAYQNSGSNIVCPTSGSGWGNFIRAIKIR